LAMHELIIDARFLKIRIYKKPSGFGTVQSLSVSGAIDINLTGLDFQGSFFYSHNIDAVDFDPKAHFMDINFSAMRNAQFYRANFENAWFTRSTLATVWFNNCRWPFEDGYKLLREDKVDENTSIKDPEALILQYTQLKKNFEDARDYIGAGDWFYREMEIRRKQAKSEAVNLKKKFPFHLYTINLYKFISNYGESYSRPLLGLISIWVIFSFLYLFNGFIIGNNPEINYDFSRTWPFTVQHFIDFCKSLLASISAMALQVGRIVHFDNAWTVALSLIQFTATAIFFPLFLLALRRKFRR